MKITWFLGFCVLIAGCTTAQPLVGSSSRNPSSLSSLELCQRLNSLEIHAHRGAWDRPENMMQAFLRAIDQGADYIEMDLQITKDDHIVVAHDAFMKKECRDAQGKEIHGQVFYRQMTLETVKTYDCGSVVTRGAPVPGEKIPTLIEVLNSLKLKTAKSGRPLKLNIEIKFNPTQPQYYPSREFYVGRILATITESGIEPSRVMIQSFDIDILRLVRAKRADLRMAPLFSDLANGVKIAQELKADLITPHFDKVDPTMLAAFHQKSITHPGGIKVVPWTVNDPDKAKQLIEWGVDGLITDNPEWFDFAKSFCVGK